MTNCPNYHKWKMREQKRLRIIVFGKWEQNISLPEPSVFPTRRFRDISYTAASSERISEQRPIQYLILLSSHWVHPTRTSPRSPPPTPAKLKDNVRAGTPAIGLCGLHHWKKGTSAPFAEIYQRGLYVTDAYTLYGKLDTKWDKLLLCVLPVLDKSVLVRVRSMVTKFVNDKFSPNSM
jgi:hypothetical protein